MLEKNMLKRITGGFEVAIWLVLCLLPIAGQDGDSARGVKENKDDFEKPYHLCWELKSENAVAEFPASDNARALYFSTSEGIFKSNDVISGLSNWQSNIGGEIKATPVFDKGYIYLLTKNSKINGTEFYSIVSLDKTTGITEWRTEVDLNDEPETFYLKKTGRNLLLATDRGQILSLNISDGKIIRRGLSGSRLSSPPFFDKGEIIFGTVEKHFVSFDENDLTKTLEIKIAEAPTVAAAGKNGDLLWGGIRGFVTSTDRRGRDGWKFRSGGKITGILETVSGFLVVSQDNYLYMLSAGGKIIWKKRLAERLFFAPAIFGKVVAVTTAAPAGVLLIELASGRTINKITSQMEDFWRGSPIVFEHLIILNTSEGFSAYSNDGCSVQTTGHSGENNRR